MSEMIERVLKAIQQEDDPISDGSHTQRFSPPNAREDRQRRMARAAIEAMREPTDEMMVEAEDAVPVLECFSEKEGSPSFLAWQAMIDAALSEKP